MNSSRPSLEQIFETHIQTLCLSLRPNTVAEYRYIGRRFFAYLRTAFPEVHRLSQLRRDPHLLSWFRWLSEQQPPLSNTTRFHYLIRLRRLLHSLPANHSIQPDFIRREDFPVQPRYLPRPLSLQEDQLLQQELRRTDNLVANALLLMRATGIRIGECLDLSLDCLRQLEPDRWALHVPLGKLHTERLVPADPEIRQVVERILALRASAPPSYLAKSQPLLLPRSRRQTLDKTLRSVLAQTAKRAGCSRSIHFAALRLTHMHRQQVHRPRIPLTQQPLAILPAPAKHLVGVYSVRQRHACHRCARLQSLFDDSALLFHWPTPPLRLSLNGCPLGSVHLFPQVGTFVSVHIGSSSAPTHTSSRCADRTLTVCTTIRYL
jgi:site-specific recombinase XerD